MTSAAGKTEIDADVRQGTRRDAILFSVGANAAHGLRRSNADKRRAVETLLNDEEWRGWSDRVVAEKTGTTHPFVAKVRAEVAPQVETVTTSERRGADGKTYPLSTSKPVPQPKLASDFAASAGPVSPEVQEAFAEAQHMLRGIRERVVDVFGDSEDAASVSPTRRWA